MTATPAESAQSARSTRSDQPTGIWRWAFLVRPGWLAMIAAVLGFAAACFLILAPWQFGRNAERSTQNDAVQAAVSASAVPVTDLMSTTAEPAAIAIWRPVTATGIYEADRQVYVRLRQDSGGNPVSEVIVPLLLADGTRLLVDRGYVSFSDVQEGVPLPALPTGTVTVTGRVQVDQTDPANRAAVQVDGRTEVYAINAAAVLPVAAAAGLAVLDVIRDEALMENAHTVGAYLMDGLREIGNRHVQIGDIRGSGLFVGLELVRDREFREPAPEIASRMINGLRNHGILIGAAGPYGSTLKIRPPLCFTRENADMVVSACDAVLGDVAAA